MISLFLFYECTFEKVFAIEKVSAKEKKKKKKGGGGLVVNLFVGTLCVRKVAQDPRCSNAECAGAK